jgi:hypothetical protein
MQALQPPERTGTSSDGYWSGSLCRIPHMNFHEKALFVKADVAAPRDRALRLRALRAMLPSALSVSPFFCGSVHYGTRLDSD